MADSSSAPRPTSPAPEETAPLLTEFPNESAIDEYAASTAQVPKSVGIATQVCLVGSAIGLVILFAAFIMTSIIEHTNWAFSRLRESCWQLALTLLISLILSSINLRKQRRSSNTNSSPLPLLLNLLADVLLIYFILYLSVSTINDATRTTCYDYRGNRQPLCERLHLAVVIVGISGAAVAAVVSLSHVVTFFVGCRAAYKGQSWIGSLPLMIPAGQFAIELSFKLARQERGVQL